MSPALVAVVMAASAAVGPAEPTAPTGWNPVDAHGVHRYAALGLFGSGGALTPAQAVVAKDIRNPLFSQDRPWETRIDNGYPNVVYDSDAAAAGDGPWRLWYGNIGPGGQYLLYANSTDGIVWDKPDLDRYDLAARWGKRDPAVGRLGKHNNVVMVGGGLGIYRDLHEPDPALRYKISGGAPGGCYSADGNTDCVVGTAGSPDGITRWTDVEPLGFPAPWRPDCHTNLFYDEPLKQYIMTTRSYADPAGRLISLARTNSSGRGRDVFVKNGSWSNLYHNEYPPAAAVPGGSGCFTLPDGYKTADGCAAACDKTPSCRYFWTYTGGKKAGTCCMKTAIKPGPLEKPACPSCGGIFAAMDGKLVRVNASEFNSWIGEPAIIERGTRDHQLYSQITWRFYDIFFGIVMTFDAEDPAGHVHCMLSWSNDSKTWQWVDPAGLAALKEFIPAGPKGSFDSHVCFAAHLPLRMPDGSSRVYFMGGNGPHSGARNSSFALATLPADRFAGVMAGPGEGGHAVVTRRDLNITGGQIIVTVDIVPGGSFSVGVEASTRFARSLPVTTSGTDVAVRFAAAPGGLSPDLIGQRHRLVIFAEDATVHTIGFRQVS